MKLIMKHFINFILDNYSTSAFHWYIAMANPITDAACGTFGSSSQLGSLGKAAEETEGGVCLTWTHSHTCSSLSEATSWLPSPFERLPSHAAICQAQLHSFCVGPSGWHSLILNTALGVLNIILFLPSTIFLLQFTHTHTSAKYFHYGLCTPQRSAS